MEKITVREASKDRQRNGADEEIESINQLPFLQHCLGTFAAISLALIFGFGAYDDLQIAQAFEKDSVIVTGRVIRFEQGQNGNVSPVLSYSFQDRAYEHRVPTKDGRYNMNELRAGHFEVRLVRSNPQVALVNTWEQPPVFLPWIFMAGAAAFISVGLLASLIGRMVRRQF
ncbi:hypothetical protein PQQ86_26955 [Paraburkholderia sediminicola]|uniref:hypothetical protein n=1 Tax=Paraburkholderia sediminicola TaxID=458836 RepID=UPI0038BD7ABD